MAAGIKAFFFPPGFGFEATCVCLKVLLLCCLGDIPNTLRVMEEYGKNLGP